MRYFIYLSIVFLSLGCIEKYDFNVLNQKEGLVIESSISDKSFRETLDYPSDGRYFTVKLSKTSDVDNIRNEKITNAKVFIKDNNGNIYDYTEDSETEGKYILFDSSFKALPEKEYCLEVILIGGQHFKSVWEKLPAISTAVGDINFTETSQKRYEYTSSGGRTLVEKEGVEINTMLPKRNDGNPTFYKWDFEPLWVFRASKASQYSDIKECWVTSDYYLKEFVLQQDNSGGGYPKDLFFLETQGNDRTYVYFSSLIIQQQLSPQYYNFWKDFLAQKEKGGLYDQPPFGLSTNFTSVGNDWTVNGYFGVMNESATRWELDYNQLSYVIINNLKELCDLPTGPKDPSEPDQCDDCRAYNQGVSVNRKPLWWSKNIP